MYILIFTFNSGLEWAACDMNTSISDYDKVVTGRGGGVCEFITFLGLFALQLDLGRTFNGYGQCSSSSIDSVHHELRNFTCSKFNIL